MSLWTPGGEHEVPPSANAAPPTAPPSPPTAATSAGGPTDRADWRERLASGQLDVEDLTPEQRAEVEAAVAQMAESQRELLATPIEQLVAQHFLGLRELAVLHLQQASPDFAAAQVAIDAMAGMLEATKGRLGELDEPFTHELSQLQMAFVDRKTKIESGGSSATDP